MIHPLYRTISVLAFGLLTTVAQPARADFSQLTPSGGIPNIQFEHLVMNAKSQFVAVSESNIYVGDAVTGRLERVFANNHVGFMLRDHFSQMNGTESQQLDLDILSTRVAINANGDYVIASHTLLFVGKVSGGEPRKVYEDQAATFQAVALNDAGHFVAISNRSLIAGSVADAAATRLVERAPGTFIGYTVDGINGNWGIEVGETHLALNASGQFVAVSGQAVYGGSVPQLKVQKVYEDSKTGFRQVQLSPTGEYVVLSVRNVFRGKLE